MIFFLSAVWFLSSGQAQLILHIFHTYCSVWFGSCRKGPFMRLLFASSKLGFLGSPPGVLSSSRIAQVHSYDHPGILRVCSHSLNLFRSWFKCYLYECILIVQMYTQNQCIFLYIRFPVYKIYLKETHTHTYIFIYIIYIHIYSYIHSYIWNIYMKYIWNVFISCI